VPAGSLTLAQQQGEHADLPKAGQALIELGSCRGGGGRRLGAAGCGRSGALRTRRFRYDVRATADRLDAGGLARV
jgi:hypothetical protein